MFIYPLKYIRVTNDFHQGKSIDFGWDKITGNKNIPVFSIGDGIIYKIEKQTKGGNVLYIKHDNDYISEYAHLENNSIRYRVGDYVTRNDWIANMGGTGKVTGNHLHFSLYKGSIKNSNKVDIFKNLLLYGDEVVVSTLKHRVYRYDEIMYVYNVDYEGLVVRDNDFKKTDKLLTVGTKINVLDIRDDYIKVGNNEWVNLNYLTTKKPAIYEVYNAPTGLNVRDKANLKSKIVDVIFDGTKVMIYGKENNFSKISDKPKRYVYSSYLKKVE